MTNTLIKISCTIDAPVAHVWDVHTTPEHIVNWNFASADWCCPYADVDLRSGGRYLARMEAKDGSFGFDYEGIYHIVEAPHKSVLILGDGRKVETVFTPDDGGTRVQVSFDADTNAPLEMQQDGWQSILNSFKERCEATV